MLILKNSDIRVEFTTALRNAGNQSLSAPHKVAGTKVKGSIEVQRKSLEYTRICRLKHKCVLLFQITMGAAWQRHPINHIMSTHLWTFGVKGRGGMMLHCGFS
jgi:hypothetical protein